MDSESLKRLLAKKPHHADEILLPEKELIFANITKFRESTRQTI